MNQYEQATLLKDYQDVFKGQSNAQQGLRVLFDMLNRCGVFVTNTKSPHDAAVLEGKRTVGVYLMQMVEMAPQYGGELTPKHMAEFTESATTAKKYHEVIKHESLSQEEKKDG